MLPMPTSQSEGGGLMAARGDDNTKDWGIPAGPHTVPPCFSSAARLLVAFNLLTYPSKVR